MFSRASGFSHDRANRESNGRERNLSTGRLPPQTHQIMDAFLWNTSRNASTYEQKKRAEVQLRILSRLKRPASTVSHEEMQTLVPGKSSTSSSRHHKHSVGGFPSSESTSPGGNTGSHDTTCNDLGYHSEYSSATSRSDMYSPHRDNNILGSTGNHNDIGSSHLGDPSDTDRFVIRSPHRGDNMPDNPQRKANNEITKTTERRNNHNRQSIYPLTSQPLSIQFDEEEEDIVCCDGSQCHEGTKNICTIAVWAVVLLFICNRFFVHFAMHLNKHESVDSKHDSYVPTGSGGVKGKRN